LEKHPNHYATPVIAIECNRLDFPIGTEKSAQLKKLVAKYCRHNAASLQLLYNLRMAYMHEGMLKEAMQQFDLVVSESKSIDSNSTFYSKNMIISAEKTKAIIQFDLGHKESGNKTAEALMKHYPDSHQAFELKRIVDRHNDEGNLYGCREYNPSCANRNRAFIRDVQNYSEKSGWKK
jgi:hypothetical protein